MLASRYTRPAVHDPEAVGVGVHRQAQVRPGGPDAGREILEKFLGGLRPVPAEVGVPVAVEQFHLHPRLRQEGVQVIPAGAVEHVHHHLEARPSQDLQVHQGLEVLEIGGPGLQVDNHPLLPGLGQGHNLHGFRNESPDQGLDGLGDRLRGRPAAGGRELDAVVLRGLWLAVMLIAPARLPSRVA